MRLGSERRQYLPEEYLHARTRVDLRSCCVIQVLCLSEGVLQGFHLEGESTVCSKKVI